MPTSDKFLASFGLRVGSKFDGYILDVVNSTHDSIKRYQEYEYHIKLVFRNENNGTWENLFKVLNKNISKETIVKGVRNPYRCIIDHPTDVHQDDNGDITVNLIGHSYRIYS